MSSSLGPKEVYYGFSLCMNETIKTPKIAKKIYDVAIIHDVKAHLIKANRLAMLRKLNRRG